ncbi:hypothetical protein SI65_02327 [Aspergillus cristatus]|uniref:Uncharacterized protein n=1 Tax=Aspergillus cristatus TaxID=573508 RepID=A0A1E3BKG7_ASPCR|nr:hypothetical protein SI65_02327 [Aspergillus cristatus]
MSSPSRPNDYGSDLWIRDSQAQTRRPTSGRGLFAGLQDVKHYNVESGWAKRSVRDENPGILGFLGRWVWGGYTPPRE